MTPSVTLQVSGAQLALIQPVRSRPLKRETNPSSSTAHVVNAVWRAISKRNETFFMLQSKCYRCSRHASGIRANGRRIRTCTQQGREGRFETHRTEHNFLTAFGGRKAYSSR